MYELYGILVFRVSLSLSFLGISLFALDIWKRWLATRSADTTNLLLMPTTVVILLAVGLAVAVIEKWW